MAPTDSHWTGGDNPARRDLANWWKNFKKNPAQKREEVRGQRPLSANFEPGLIMCTAENADPQGIFGVPLHTSVKYANVAISLTDAQGNSYIYGYVPIVVAKCGVYLKEKGTVQWEMRTKLLSAAASLACKIPANGHSNRR
jgi:hypothetical protein